MASDENSASVNTDETAASAPASSGLSSTSTVPPASSSAEGENATSGGATPASDEAANLPSSVNKQILDAVRATTDFTFGLNAKLMEPVKDGSRLSSGAAIAFDKAAQAAALSMQDASDYMRNVMSVAGVAQGKAMAEILAGVNVANATTVMTLAQTAVSEATKAVTALGTAQTGMLTSFPRS